MDCWSEMRSENNRLWVSKSRTNCSCARNWLLIGDAEGEQQGVSVSIYQLLLCKEWIADQRCGVETIASEYLNLVPIALVQGMDCWSEMGSGNNSEWVSKSSTKRSYARNGLLIADMEFEQETVSVSIYQLLLCKEWIADWICGVGTIASECLNLVPIALMQGMHCWSQMWSSNNRRWVYQSTNCSCARNGLLIGDAEW